MTLSRTGLLVLCLGIGGCRDSYQQRNLPADSPQAAQVRDMLAALRSAGAAGLEKVIAQQSAGDLTPPQQAGLRATLAELAAAPAVELVRVDRFGDNVFRAALKLAGPAGDREMFILLVDSGGQLRWAGRS